MALMSCLVKITTQGRSSEMIGIHVFSFTCLSSFLVLFCSSCYFAKDGKEWDYGSV